MKGLTTNKRFIIEWYFPFFDKQITYGVIWDSYDVTTSFPLSCVTTTPTLGIQFKALTLAAFSERCSVFTKKLKNAIRLQLLSIKIVAYFLCCRTKINSEMFKKIFVWIWEEFYWRVNSTFRKKLYFFIMIKNICYYTLKAEVRQLWRLKLNEFFST